MGSIINKIVSGDELRKTRFHALSGEMVSMRKSIQLIPSVISWIGFKVAGRRYQLPWWTWDAITFVESKLDTKDRVLEVGSGMSTIWLAGKCSFVDAIEQNKEWSVEVMKTANINHVNNVRIHEGDEKLLNQELLVTEENNFTVGIVDGAADRLGIFSQMISSRSAFRIIVFDDTDRSEYQEAFIWSEENGYRAYRFVGFKPQTLHVCETTVFINEYDRQA